MKKKSDIKMVKELFPKFEFVEAQSWYHMYLHSGIFQAHKGPRNIHGSLALLYPEHDILAFNRVLNITPDNHAFPDQLTRLLDVYHQAGVSRFFLPIPPMYANEQLDESLNIRGFVPYNHWTKLYRNIECEIPVVHTDFELRVLTKLHLDDFAQLIATCFDWPEDIGQLFARSIGKKNFYHYGLFDREMLIAAAGLFINNGIGYMAVAATQPEFRGQGAQKMLLFHRIKEAQRFGCQYVSTETAHPLPERPVISYDNMIKMGFEVAYHRANYIYYFE